MSDSKTHWKKMTNPNYLGTYALEPGKDLIGTISKVQKEEVTSPTGETDECIVVHFSEDIKPFILNTTNAKQIERLYDTPYIEEWVGKQIQIYVKEGIEAFGKITTGLRIRPKVPQKMKPELTPEHEKWPDAVENVAKGNTTINVIRKHYTLTDDMKAMLIEDVEDYNESQLEKQTA